MRLPLHELSANESPAFSLAGWVLERGSLLCGFSFCICFFLAAGSDPQWPASEVMGLDPWRYNKGEVSCWIATETEGALKVASG